jgi:hypothetical protein
MAALEAATKTAIQVRLGCREVGNLERGGGLERVQPISFAGKPL